MTEFTLPENVCWIGPERVGGKHPIEVTYFKTVFDMEKLPKTANLSISANTRFTLYVNGKEILNGPCRGDYWHQFCDTIDIAPYLTTGTNILAAKVVAYVPLEAHNDDRSNAGPLWDVSNSAGPMLICHGEFAKISTGIADWYYLNDKAIKWQMQQIVYWMGCCEDVDGTKLPHGWEKDASVKKFAPAKLKWTNNMFLGEIPRLYLYERPIEHLLRIDKPLAEQALRGEAFTGQDSVTIPANETFETIIDVGQLTTAFVYFPMSGGAGSTVKILYSEAFVKAEQNERGRNMKEVRSDATGFLPGAEDVYRPGGRDEVYSPLWFRTFRFVKISVQTGDTPLTINPPRLTETRYPLNDYVNFATPADWVKPVWDISLRTLELCMHETYEDCPFYEQLQYVMDTRLQILFTYAISNDVTLARKTLHDYHTSILPEGIVQSRFPTKNFQVIPAFALHWIFMLRDYYMETGDVDTLDRYRPTVESILAWFKRKTGESGLVENLGYWDFADWTDAWRSGVPNAARTGPSTIQNLVYAYALRVGADIMQTLKIDELARRYKNERKNILFNIEITTWCHKKGLYKEGPGFDEYSQHAQVWAVINGLATGARAQKIMTRVLEDKDLVPCSFVWQYYLFRALEKADMYEETEKLWPMWQELLGLDLTTIPEIPSKYTRSDCHAWGALLLYELPRRFLGVQALEPGYKKISIRPMGLFLGKMSGRVPTPHGDVTVQWSVKDGQFKLQGNTPVPAELTLPNGIVFDVLGDFSVLVEL